MIMCNKRCVLHRQCTAYMYGWNMRTNVLKALYQREGGLSLCRKAFAENGKPRNMHINRFELQMGIKFATF